MSFRLAGGHVILFAALAATVVYAKDDPRIGYLYPAGGQQGTTFDVTVGGQFLKGATNVVVSGAGVDVTVLRYVKALTKKELNDLRKTMGEVRKHRDQERKAALKAAGNSTKSAPAKGPAMDAMESMAPDAWPMDPRDLDMSTMSTSDLRMLRAILFNAKKQPNAQLDDRVLLSITLAPDAEPGTRELRVLTARGLSNPVNLSVGTFAEQLEREPNEKTATPIVSLPAVLNGQIMPGDVDRFRFHAKQGQRIVANVQARALIPYLADAVPGWFQAVLVLYDAEGEQLALADDFRFDPDPVLRFEVPEDGEYELLIRDSIYRGREDFVYRIAVGELPFVERAFPLGGQVGESTRVRLQGWNLPVESVLVDGTTRSAGIQRVTPPLMDAGRPIMFALDTLEEQRDREPNNLSASAQPVTLPLIINGEISRPGDRDVFRFEGKKQQVITAEVFARRLNSPLDSILKLTDSEGNDIAVNDDEKDVTAGLTTHHADSRLMATLPEDGTYRLHVADAQHAGGPAYAYRLRLAGAQPDFMLRVTPSSVNMFAGDATVLNVIAVRRDGFAGDIKLELVEAPPGFVLGGGLIPAGQDRIFVTLTAPREMAREPMDLRIAGVASVAGGEVRHDAVAAEDMMQAFLWRHLVPSKGLMVSRIWRKWARPPVTCMSDTPVLLEAGGTAVVAFRDQTRRREEMLELELSGAPDGITLGNVTPVEGGVDVTLLCDKDTVTPGMRGNLILTAFMKREIKDKDKKPTGKMRRHPLGFLPAVPFVVAER